MILTLGWITVLLPTKMGNATPRRSVLLPTNRWRFRRPSEVALRTRKPPVQSWHGTCNEHRTQFDSCKWSMDSIPRIDCWTHFSCTSTMFCREIRLGSVAQLDRWLIRQLWPIPLAFGSLSDIFLLLLENCTDECITKLRPRLCQPTFVPIKLIISMYQQFRPSWSIDNVLAEILWPEKIYRQRANLSERSFCWYVD